MELDNYWKKHFRKMLLMAIYMVWMLGITYALAFILLWLENYSEKIKTLQQLMLSGMVIIWIGAFLSAMKWLDEKN